MRPSRLSLAPSALVWFGLLGAPFAWALQHVTGYALTEAACSQAGTRWDISVDGITAILTGGAGAVAVLAGLAALKAWRDTRPVEGTGGAEEPPPRGRIHFLAVVGMTIAPLFLFIILMSGLGVLSLPQCHQS